MYWIALGAHNSEQLLCLTHATVLSRISLFLASFDFGADFSCENGSTAPYVCESMISIPLKYSSSKRDLRMRSELLYNKTFVRN